MVFRHSDIALIKLPKPIERSEYAHPIALAPPSATPIPNGKETIAITLGPTNLKTLSSPGVLQYAKLKTIDLQNCEKNINALISKNSEICVQKDTVSICEGDAGAPLVFQNILVGIGSLPPPKCALGGPQRFVGIAAYTKWIQDAMKGVLYMG